MAETDPHGDTTVSLRVYVDTKIAALESMHATDLSGVAKLREMYIAAMQEQVDRRFMHVDRELANIAALNQKQFETVEKNTVLAQAAMNDRFNSVNEFRAQLRDQTSSMISRSESNQAIKSMEDRVDSLNKNLLDRMSASDKRINDMENIIANWQGRFLILASLAMIIPISVTILMHYWK